MACLSKAEIYLIWLSIFRVVGKCFNKMSDLKIPKEICLWNFINLLELLK